MATQPNGQGGSPTHVLVTHWTAPGGRIVVHAYGPWSQQVCRAERKKLWERPDQSGLLMIHICKMLDVRG